MAGRRGYANERYHAGVNAEPLYDNPGEQDVTVYDTPGAMDPPPTAAATGFASSEQTFSKWCAYKLSGNHTDVEPQFSREELYDGTVLLPLLNVLLSRNEKPRQGETKLQAAMRVIEKNNITISPKSLRTLKDESAPPATQEELATQEESVLSVLWYLIRHFDIFHFHTRPTADKDQRKTGDVVKQWLNELLPSKDHNSFQNPIDFDNSWQSGQALYDLVHCLTDIRPADEPLAKAQLALDEAEKLGVPKLISAQDLIDGKLDNLSMLTYLAQLRNTTSPTSKLKRPQGPSISSSRLPPRATYRVIKPATPSDDQSRSFVCPPRQQSEPPTPQPRDDEPQMATSQEVNQGEISQFTAAVDGDVDIFAPICPACNQRVSMEDSVQLDGQTDWYHHRCFLQWRHAVAQRNAEKVALSQQTEHQPVPQHQPAPEYQPQPHKHVVHMVDPRPDAPMLQPLPVISFPPPADMAQPVAITPITPLTPAPRPERARLAIRQETIQKTQYQISLPGWEARVWQAPTGPRRARSFPVNIVGSTDLARALGVSGPAWLQITLEDIAILHQTRPEVVLYATPLNQVARYGRSPGLFMLEIVPINIPGNEGTLWFKTNRQETAFRVFERYSAFWGR